MKTGSISSRCWLDPPKLIPFRYLVVRSDFYGQRPVRHVTWWEPQMNGSISVNYDYDYYFFTAFRPTWGILLGLHLHQSSRTSFRFSLAEKGRKEIEPVVTWKKKLKNKIKIIDAERSGWNRLSTPFSVENLMERGHESYITAAIGRTGPSFFLSPFFWKLKMWKCREKKQTNKKPTNNRNGRKKKWKTWKHGFFFLFAFFRRHSKSSPVSRADADWWLAAANEKQELH